MEIQHRKPGLHSNWFSKHCCSVEGIKTKLDIKHSPEAINGRVYYNACGRVTTIKSHKDFVLKFKIEPSTKHGSVTRVYMSDNAISGDHVDLFLMRPYILTGGHMRLGQSRVFRKPNEVQVQVKSGICKVYSDDTLVSEFPVEEKERYIMFQVEATDKVTHLHPIEASSYVYDVEVKNTSDV